VDFKLTDEQLEIKRAVREFSEKEFDPDLALELDKKEEFPMKLYKKAAKMGFTSLFIPEEYGGQGYGYIEASIAWEEMCRADSSLGLATSIGVFGSDLLLFHGTEEQKKKYLPPLCRGEFISAAAFTEPSRGSDLTKMDTKATKYGDEWWINGTKKFITNAPIADFTIVLCQTDAKVRPTYKGQTLFIIDGDAPGIEVSKQTNKMGIRCTATGDISLSDVKVTDTNVIGELNRGFYHSMQFFDVSRIVVAAQAVGTAQGAFEIAFKHAKQREVFGQPILQFQQIGCNLAQVATEVEAARLLTYKAAWTVDQGSMDPMLTSMAKLYASRAAVKAADVAIQTLGGYGYMSEYRVERYYRDAKITEIYEGTSEIQRLAILRHLLRMF
jgi:alkylation response protein AidB-like acyl-CoA dehydrogenase